MSKKQLHTLWFVIKVSFSITMTEIMRLITILTGLRKEFTTIDALVCILFFSWAIQFIGDRIMYRKYGLYKSYYEEDND